MKRMDYDRYLDKIFGCFLGKCIGGTAGGPAEGRKELLDAPLNEEILHSTLPNDDLDLQLIWLELLEEYGPDITARDMGRAFCEMVPYGPGEYGYFMKNFNCGIYPPTSGSYNNRYYKNGMGCPIRGEIWACLFPGAPALTEKYVRMDGSLDHERDSIDAEYFISSLESEAFFAEGYESIIPLIRSALLKLNRGSKIYKAINDALEFYLAGKDWKWSRGEILRRYGHSDCTNLYQNMAFTVLTLLYCRGEFRETVRLALAMGYDTDCVCATVASILGIIKGGKALIEEDKMTDTGLTVTVNTKRRAGSIYDLAKDVCRVGVCLSEITEGAAKIDNAPSFEPLPKREIPEYTIRYEYEGNPSLSLGKESRANLYVKRNRGEGAAKVSVTAPSGIVATVCPEEIYLGEGDEAYLTVTASISPDCEILKRSNILTVSIGDFEDTFGFMGCYVFKRFGPFLMNNQDLSDKVLPHLPYSGAIVSDGDNSLYDALRDYHLNTFADINRSFVPEEEPFLDIEPDGSAARDYEIISTEEDLFDLADIQGYSGPHTDYLVTTLISPEDREIELALGHTAPFKLFINGKLIGMSERDTWWTCENRHFTVKLNKGENTLILKCAQKTDSAKYSIIPRHVSGSWVQHYDIDCKIPR